MQLIALEDLAGGALAGVQIVDQLMHSSDGLLGFVVERGIFQQLPGGALACLQILHHFVDAAQGLAEIVIQLVIVDQLSDGAVVAVQGLGEFADLIDHGQDMVVERGVFQQLADAALAGLDVVDQLIDAVDGALQGNHNGIAFLHQAVESFGVEAGDLSARLDCSFAPAGLDVDVLGAQKIRGADGRNRIHWDVLQAALGNFHGDTDQALGILETGKRDVFQFADLNAIQVDRSGFGERGGIAQVGIQGGFGFEEVDLAGNQENQDGENNQGGER